MNHRRKGKTFGRVAKKRKAMFRSLAVSLIKSGKIKTTLAKAKALRPYIEKTVSLAKRKDLAVIRSLYKEFNKETVDLLVGQWGPLFKGRKGGYTRINKLLQRSSDASPMALIEFVEKPSVAAAKDAKKEKAVSRKPEKEKAQ